MNQALVDEWRATLNNLEWEDAPNVDSWRDCAVGAFFPVEAARLHEVQYLVHRDFDETSDQFFAKMDAHLTPHEVELRNLGIRFTDAVNDQDADAALDVFKEIESLQKIK